MTGCSLVGIKKASLKINAKGEAKFRLQPVKTNLSNADPVSHFVYSTLTAGDFEAENRRLARFKGTALKIQEPSPRITCPGRAPVGTPSLTIGTPLTMTCR